MCRPAKCPLCHKTTWVGCGMHVDSVMRNVPKDQQCACPRDKVEEAMGGGGCTVA
ncbi:hypothetical protein AMAG_13289 [Allomyces macrogynus ATCC 38327]|uniref:Uncharacterized protein n=1 Tax=Allomyces macrogynus (strain ATCC 38327) TaxID=578462 RepID=A0A0L0T0L4_ALLM3|nr:hypothetical protein GGF32_003926 [Allomyces javanicus]KNE68119.1 hypothetical protein AMAG_13289 [Allomyces macrogynus ATCC 38327]|eukprot:KNE68119.1 hypothetical protein AMAG_13289 [Allomyces macrogynus ATCC 38327]